MKPSGIGGMAVMEGVMMKNKDKYAVAIRKPNNEIIVEESTYTDFSDRVKLFKLPIFRGMLAFVDSMVMGVKVLNFSASFLEEEEEAASKEKKDKSKGRAEKKAREYDDDFEIDEVADKLSKGTKKGTKAAKEEKPGRKGDKGNAILVAVAVLFSIVLSVALFMVLPVLITNLLSGIIPGKYTLAFLEGVLRLAIFIIYVIIAAKMPDIKRTFMYHGAEHKAINCLENGFELTVENVKWQSKLHKRCGTSFMLLVIIISLFFFFLMPVEDLVLRIISRVLLVPLIAGISYEFIRFAGTSESRLVHILSQPGLWMQGLTTKEPDDEMIEVAIRSVGAIFDWEAFLADPAADDKNKNVNNSKSTSSRNSSSRGRKAMDRKERGRADAVTKEVSAIMEGPVAKEVSAAVEVPVAKEVSAAVEMPVTREGSAEWEVPVTRDGSAAKEAGYRERNRRNRGIAPVAFKPVIKDETEEEDDEILKALDRFFDGQRGGKQDND
ncbi:MAG TPA: DUF1385 domain-containing protein [Clostridiales bacterium]|nr:DUF1385 domain-containing protein [Clostridiales bacterium]